MGWHDDDGDGNRGATRGDGAADGDCYHGIDEHAGACAGCWHWLW